MGRRLVNLLPVAQRTNALTPTARVQLVVVAVVVLVLIVVGTCGNLFYERSLKSGLRVLRIQALTGSDFRKVRSARSYRC